MLIRTVTDIGALVRERRQALGLTQQQVADQVGTRRQWVIALEAGRSATDTRLLLRALDVLGLRLDITTPEEPGPGSVAPATDLDEHRRGVRGRRP